MSVQVQSKSWSHEFSHNVIAEADHRIANSLQLISSLVRQRAKHDWGSDPRTFLLEMADRIETVGKLHMFLTRSTTGAVPLGSYLNEICEHLTGALASDATIFALDCPEDCQIPARIALSLGLITAELVSNSLKYAHPAGLPVKIRLSCSRDENGDVRILYEDDGVGFPEDFDIAATGHMGMRFIGMLSQGVAGQHEWHSDSLGIRFELALSKMGEVEAAEGRA